MLTAGWGTVWGLWRGCSTLNCGEPGEQPKGWTPLEEMTHTHTHSLNIKQESKSLNIMRGYHRLHLLINVLQSEQQPCENPALALNRHTHPAAFTSPQVIYLKNQLCSFPRWVTWHVHPQKESFSFQKLRLECSWPSEAGGVFRLLWWLGYSAAAG